MLPLTSLQLIQNVLDEVQLCLADKSSMITIVENKQIFNDIYDVELTEIYGNSELYEHFRQGLRATKAC